jgi:hypothetical protein
MFFMKNKRPPNGRIDRVIDELLGSMVGQLGGSCIHVREGLKLSIPGDVNAEIVCYAPSTQDEWTTRLKWVEKQAAIFLLNAPILYRVKWSGKNSNRRGLRLSVGLSLSVGVPLPKRYTCVMTHGSDEIRFSERGALSVDGGSEVGSAGLPSWVTADLSKLGTGVLAACDHFRQHSDVQNSIRKLGVDRRAELTNLDHLYRRKQGANARLYGFPTPGSEGSASIEAELRNLQNIVLQRYAVGIRIRFLSLGILEGGIPEKFYRAGELVGKY